MLEAQLMDLAKQNGIWRPGTDQYHSLSQQIENSQSDFEFISGRNCYDVLDQVIERADTAGQVKGTDLMKYAQDPRKGSNLEKFLGPVIGALGTALFYALVKYIKQRLESYSA